jgi:hypothetical protein
LTAEQLEASRSERMRLDGHGALTLEDARVWIEETGFCLFLPKRQYSISIAPSFVEAVAGQRNTTPDPKHIALAEELLVRLELDGVAVRLNLLGQVGEQPDFVVAAWVLPYVYALRGDRDWRRSPQLTGSRQVSQLAVQAYKQLELGDTTVSKLTYALGREVTEGAVLRAITELWQQLRIIPVVAAPGQAAEWQLLRTRFQKAIAEGASTSQVTAISVLASIYLQAVIAASMEEVELFLAPLTARSKVREVLRGLVATRQVHTLSMGHAPHYYVAGTLPEFAEPANTVYTSSSMPASAYFMHSREEEDVPEPVALEAAAEAPSAPLLARKSVDSHAPRAAARKAAGQGKPAAARPHFSRPATSSRDRKPAQSSSSSRPARRTGSDARTTSRPSSATRWAANGANGANGASNGNGTHAANGASAGPHSNGNGAARTSRPANGAGGARAQKPAPAPWTQRNGHANGAKPADKAGSSRNGSGLSRSGSAPRPDSRSEARPARAASRKPTLTAGTKVGNSKRFGFTARPNQETKKRG